MSDWVANPLTDIGAIDARLDAVAELVADAGIGRRACASHSRACSMSSGLLARVTTGRASPRDLSCLARTLAACRRSRPS